MQSNWLLAAALLTFAVGVAHSVLGEKYILMRLVVEGKLRARTLRFAWHLAWPVFLAIAITSLWAAA
ncbi:MAG: hypothetical protein ACRER4_02315 [Steroidobacteraceae bacterium]